MSNFAWVTLATNDSYSLGALVVAHSLKRVHTAHQLAVLITPGVSEAMKNKLRTIFNVVEEVNLLDSKDEANLALLKRPELGITFTKLHCWRLTQFEKCVFLDADTLVLRNCDELFEREELSAAPDVGWPDCFNSGVFVYKPSVETFSSLMQYAVTNGSFDGGDQGLLNSYFSDWAHKDIAKHLPFIYNTSSVASYSYLPAFKQFGQSTKILHFIGTAKPWLQNFNSESRQVHVPGGYQHLANFLQYWWDIFCEDVHSRLSADMSGLAGALSQLHLGEPKSVEQETYEEHMRRQCWESGNIDYMGRDSFENIWRRIKQTVSAGPSPIADSSSAITDVPRAYSPAPPPRHRSSKSRSRSSTPKRDPRDRSPTPQPEDNVPVEKKEVQIDASIQEEDDNLNVAPLDESAERRKLPPPIQYDPMTCTTTLTKKVFAGYQQVITTKTQQGKTHTRTKTVYDPSVDDDDTAGYDAVDGPTHVTSATVAESRLEPVQPLEPEAEVKPTPPEPKATPTPPSVTIPQPEHKSTPPRASPRPQMEQQVAQESMAGKEPSVEPVKTIRRKRLASPPGVARTTTSIATQTTSSAKPKLKTTVAPKTATVTKTTVPSQSTPKATPQQPTKTKPAKPSQSLSSSNLTTTVASKPQSLPSPPSPATKPPPPPTTLSSTNSRPKPTKTIDEIETAPLTANDELDIASSAPSTPPVPPRRKRESKVSRIGKAQK